MVPGTFSGLANQWFLAPFLAQPINFLLTKTLIESNEEHETMKIVRFVLALLTTVAFIPALFELAIFVLKPLEAYVGDKIVLAVLALTTIAYFTVVQLICWVFDRMVRTKGRNP